MARKRKTRTHVKEDTKASNVPKSIIIKHGQVGHSIAQLVRDLRKVMEPNTASRLKVRQSRGFLPTFFSLCYRNAAETNSKIFLLSGLLSKFLIFLHSP